MSSIQAYKVDKQEGTRNLLMCMRYVVRLLTSHCSYIVVFQSLARPRTLHEPRPHLPIKQNGV